MSSQNLPSMQDSARELRTSGMDANQMYEEVRAIAGGSDATPLARGSHRSSHDAGEGELSPLPSHLLPGMGGIQRRDSDGAGMQAPYVSSQAHLLQPSDYNPMPTAVPPPISANSGTLGVRHVLFIIGLPERGKPFIARRLKNYLSFFHGADVQLFDISAYAQRSDDEPGSDANARLLLDELKAFMDREAGQHAANMHVKRASACAPAADGVPSPQRTGSGLGADNTLVDDMLVDGTDRRRKNVDSGRVAIIFASDSYRSFKEKWSGTSKERRHWAAEVLALDRALNCKLIFIEVIVNQPETIIANIRAKRRAQGEEETSPETVKEYLRRIKEYQRMYVTLQDDGSEDDLSYIKLINYGQKVVTNRMHGYLRMRIAQFLTTIHTTPHVIYLTRHGQSEYNLLGKIGGNPPLSEAGREYAQRLAAWVPENVCKDRHNNVRRVRLWTSSLQRTIRTADYIPHPLLSAADCGPGEGEDADRSGGSYNPTSSSRNRKPNSTPPLNASTAFPPVGDRLVAGGTGSFALPAATAGSGSGYPSELQLPTDIDGLAPVGSYNSLTRLTAIAQKPSEPLEPEEKWEQMSPRVYRNLDEIFAGEYEGLTYEEIKKKAPDEASLRAMDKIGYRYPRGESYYDILARLDPLVHEMESYHEPLMIVCHQAVLRVLYSYLLAKPRRELTKQEIPLHTVMRITYDGWNPPREERFFLGPNPDELQEDGQKSL